MLSRVYEFMALTIFEENLNLSEKFSSSRQPLHENLKPRLCTKPLLEHEKAGQRQALMSLAKGALKNCWPFSCYERGKLA